MTARVWHSGPPPEIAEIVSLFSYDPKSGSLVWKVRRGTVPAGTRAGYVDSSTGYLKVMISKKCYYAHRLAWLISHGVWPDQIDHINGNRTDNRIENLRSVTSTENKQNTIRSKGCIYYDERYETFYVKTTINRKEHFVGSFKDRDDAETALADFRSKVNKLHRKAFPAPENWSPASIVTRASCHRSVELLMQHFESAWTAAEMCRLAGVSKSTYKRLVLDGLMPRHVRKHKENRRIRKNKPKTKKEEA